MFKRRNSGNSKSLDVGSPTKLGFLSFSTRAKSDGLNPGSSPVENNDFIESLPKFLKIICIGDNEAFQKKMVKKKTNLQEQ